MPTHLDSMVVDLGLKLMQVDQDKTDYNRVFLHTHDEFLDFKNKTVGFE